MLQFKILGSLWAVCPTSEVDNFDSAAVLDSLRLRVQSSWFRTAGAPGLYFF
jgi:hypothetical protein